MFTVKKPTSEANVSRTIRFDEEIFNDLKNVANEEGISFNSLVLQCCRYSIDCIEKGTNKNIEG
jgi:hypothetical protein